MQKSLFLLLWMIVPPALQGQTAEADLYKKLARTADSLYHAKAYHQAALAYSRAFKANGWKGFPHDRYNAACSWALANVPDSAFFQLERIASKANYDNDDHLISDTDLLSLHADPRWEPLVALVKKNKAEKENT